MISAYDVICNINYQMQWTSQMEWTQAKGEVKEAVVKSGNWYYILMIIY